MVDGRFAAHRRIHLRQQRGRHLHKRHTAHVARSGKARHVAHHPAAQRKQHGLAVAAVLQQGIKYQVQGLPVFVFFAIGKNHHMYLSVFGRQCGAQGIGIERGYCGVGDDEGGGRFGQRRIGGAFGQQAGGDGDGVAAFGQIDGDHRRCA